MLLPTIVRLISQGFWTTTPRDFYHPNQLSTVLPGVVVQTCWLITSLLSAIDPKLVNDSNS